jgi:hypothetical protein
VPLKKYSKRDNTPITAVQLAMDVEELRYQKWGATQNAKPGDWVVSNGEDTYTVDQQSFANTYSSVGKGEYIKSGFVWAERAETPGQIATKEGQSDYAAGDYLVYNNPDRSDGYTIAGDKFHAMYQEADEPMNDKQASPLPSQVGMEDYLKTRVNDQINWYERKASANKNAYKRSQVLSILCGAAIPILTVFEGQAAIAVSRPLIALLGGTVAVLSAIVSLYKFQEYWVKYRTAAQLLQREKNLFLTQTEPYNSERAFPLFVQNCEAIMAAENSEWNQMFRSKGDSEPAS